MESERLGDVSGRVRCGYETEKRQVNDLSGISCKDTKDTTINHSDLSYQNEATVSRSRHFAAYMKSGATPLQLDMIIIRMSHQSPC